MGVFLRVREGFPLQTTKVSAMQRKGNVHQKSLEQQRDRVVFQARSLCGSLFPDEGSVGQLPGPSFFLFLFQSDLIQSPRKITFFKFVNVHNPPPSVQLFHLGAVEEVDDETADFV